MSDDSNGVSIRKGFAWLAASQGIGFIVGLLGSVIIARLLSPYEMGVYAIAAATVGIIAILRSTGLNNFLIREKILDKNIVATLFTVNLLLSIASSMFLLGVSWMSLLAFDDSAVRYVLEILALSPLLSAFEFLPVAFLERTGRFSIVSAAGIVRGFINTITTILLAMNGFSYLSIAWGNVAGACFSAIFMTTVRIPFPKFRLNFSDWRRVAVFGSQMITISLFGSISERLFDLLLGRLAGLSALGIYSRASGLNGLLWDNLHLVIGRLVLIDFAERLRRGLSLRHAYLRVFTVLTAILWPAFTGLAVLSGPIVVTIYGAQWRGAAIPLTLLAVAGIINTVVTMIWELYIVQNEIRAQMAFQLKHTISGVILFSFGCLGGLFWAAASRVGDAVITVFIAKRDVERMTETKPGDYWPIMAQSFSLTVLACGPSIVLMGLNHWSVNTNFIAVLASVAIGVALWGVGLFAHDHPLATELRALAIHLRVVLVSKLSF